MQSLLACLTCGKYAESRGAEQRSDITFANCAHVVDFFMGLILGIQNRIAFIHILNSI